VKTTRLPKLTGLTDPAPGAGWWLEPANPQPRIMVRSDVLDADGDPLVGDLVRHTIAADGKVTPSILVTGHSGLEWHIMGQLLGWSP